MYLMDYEVGFDDKTLFDYREMRAWCKKNIGEEYNLWLSYTTMNTCDFSSIKFINGLMIFYFKTATDATFFKLKWS